VIAYDLDEEPFDMLADLERYARAWDSPRRIVKQTQFHRRGNKFLVSTVHLVVNHAWMPGDLPLIYETMVFSDHPRWDTIMWSRYPFRGIAKAGHKLAVREVQESVRKKKPSERPRYKYLPGRGFHNRCPAYT
jgi:hypothetical protein